MSAANHISLLQCLCTNEYTQQQTNRRRLIQLLFDHGSEERIG